MRRLTNRSSSIDSVVHSFPPSVVEQPGWLWRVAALPEVAYGQMPSCITSQRLAWHRTAAAPLERRRTVEQELDKFKAAGDNRGEAAMKLSLAECICDRHCNSNMSHQHSS